MSQTHNDTTGTVIGQTFPEGPYKSGHGWNLNGV